MTDKRNIKSKPYKAATKSNLMLDRPTSHGPWPRGDDEYSVVEKITDWLRSMKLIEGRKRMIKEIIEEEVLFSELFDSPPSNYISHSFEPSIGDTIINNNPKCKHLGSIGTVLVILTMPDDGGRMVKYRCNNSGPHWSKGTVLRKTMDQLCPYER